MSEQPTCTSCVFAAVVADGDDGPRVDCRRYPPQVFVIGDEVTQAYPSTFEDHWCGEHQPAP